MKNLSISQILSCAMILLILGAVFFPELFTHYNPLEGVPKQKLQAPSAEHLFGTDALGRDLFARVIYGAAYSVSGAFVAVLLGLVIGLIIGLLAGSLGGIIDDIFMRLMDVLLSIPNLLLSLSIVILLGFGELNIAIAIGVTSIASFARLVRAEVIKINNSQYVEAAYCSGGTFLKVLTRHILPNSLISITAFTALQFGSAILQMSTLGFLGYGVAAPTPEWGLLISEGRKYIAIAWWLTIMPGMVIILSVLALNNISRLLNRIN